MRKFYRCRGAISVFLCLILLPTVVFGGLVTDAARIYGSESLISEAGELAMNAGLSHYDSELKDDYGLLVMSRTPESMTADLEQYFVNSINASGLAGAEEIGTMLDLECESFAAYGVEGSQIYRTEAMRQQILEYMKYRAPVCIAEELIGKVSEIKETKKQVKAVEAQIEYSRNLDDLLEACNEANEAIGTYCQRTDGFSGTLVNGELAQAKEASKNAAVRMLKIKIAENYEAAKKREGQETEDAESAGEDYSDDIETWTREFEQYLTEAAGKASAPYATAVAGIEAAEDAMAKLERLGQELSAAGRKFSDWQSRIDDLSDGDMKTNMQSDADVYRSLMEVGSYQELYRKLEANKKSLEGIKKDIEQNTFCGEAVRDLQNAEESIRQAVESLVTLPESMPEDTALATMTDEFFAANYQEKLTEETLFTITDDAFYRNLREVCQKEPESEQSREHTDKTDQLLNDAVMESSGMGIAGLTEDWGSDPLPSVALAQAGAGGEDNSRYVMESGAGTDKAGREKAFDNAKNSLNGMSDFLDKLEHLLESTIENIYITEYAIQMLSYYTVDRDADGNQRTDEIESLSGADLTDNALYKSEVEYVLWGNQDAKENVNNTRLLLYGIRMVFNTIYAFTDSEIRGIASSMATAMSCGVALLVPVFNVLIKVAVAGAETVMDVEDLMAGKSVAVIKKSGNSQLKELLGITGNATGGIEMNYREYLRLFLLVRTVGSFETATLARIADCVQLNTDMNIIEGYTMLSVKADVRSRTTFMSMVSELPGSGAGGITDDWYTITYQSVLAY